MAELVANIPVSKLAKDITATIKITGINKFKMRLWFAKWFFIAGTHIAGFKGIEIEN